MKSITCNLPDSLYKALQERMETDKASCDHVVSAAAYREGLVWPAAGTHPMSAKQPGFGTWAKPSALKRPTGPGLGADS